MSTMIAIRTDGSSQIGTGHIRRCQSISNALLRQGASTSFVVRDADIPLDLLFPGITYELRVLPIAVARQVASDEAAPDHAHWLGTDWLSDARETVAALQESQITALLVDHYAIDARWHRYVSQALGCPIVAIDDLADRPLAVQLIIDHNHAVNHTEKYSDVNELLAPVLGGPSYAMLLDRYVHATINPAVDPVCSIGIFMGGVDLLNYSEVALQGLRDHALFAGEIEIISTGANPHLSQLRNAARQDGNCRLTLDEPDLAAFFGRHQLHIGAGGGATWERCCIGAPSMALIAADNQAHVLRPLADLAVLSLLAVPHPTARDIGVKARELIDGPLLRKLLSSNARKLVDGRGAQRLAHEILKICKP